MSFARLSIAILLTGAALAAAHAECPGPRPPGLEHQSDGVVAVDLDGRDGPDLVFARESDDHLHVRYNLGDGTLADPVVIDTFERPWAVMSADLDDANGPDIVAMHYDRTVSVLLNDGTGSLLSPTEYPVGLAPSIAVAADLDGANGLDLIVVNNRDISILHGTGGGAFGPTETLRLDLATQPFGATVVELDGMNGLDLVVSNGSTGMNLLYNDGTGRFVGEQLLPLDGDPFFTTVADLDGLHGLDLVATGRDAAGDGVAWVALHTGLGYPAWTEYPMGDGALHVVAADVDGRDGLDLVINRYTAGDVAVLRNAGDGTFHPAVGHGNDATPLGLHPNDIAVADLDGADGPDIIVANWVAEPRILWNAGDGTYPLEYQREPTWPLAGGPIDIIVRDMGGSPDLDLLTVNRDSSDLAILISRGDGTFEPEVRVPVGIGDPRAVAEIDLGEEEPLELAVTLGGSNQLAVMRATGPMSFEVEQVLPMSGIGAVEVGVADLDGLHGPDIVACNQNAGGLSLFRRGADGTYGPEEVISSLGGPDGLAFADFDGVGGPDMVVGHFATSEILLFRSRGDGTFDAPETIATSLSPVGVAGVDVDGRNGPDLIAVGEFDASIFLNQGDGTFGPRQAYPADSWAHEMTVADLDGRNGPDLVASGGLDEVVIFLNRGDGSFEAGVHRLAGDDARGIVAVQLDGLRGPEIVVANAGGDELSILTECAPLGPTSLLRSAAVVSLSPVAPPLAEVLAPNAWGESLDDGDEYLTNFETGGIDPLPGGPEQPLVFYAVSDAHATIRLFKEGGAVRVEY